jgi:hypothetical protein
MSRSEILLDANGHAINPSEICKRIIDFGDSYNNTVKEIISNSKILDDNGEIFVKCASQVLSNFGMTRSGPFHENLGERLRDCWDAVGASLIEINKSVLKSGLSRDRFLLELNDQERNGLIAKIWLMTNKLLPFTMGETSYGLVGASKILFSVLPEIVLPIDNNEWLHVFKTVDIGDILNYMVSDIQNWEAITGFQLNELDHSKRLTTLPSIYNVMAMYARP